MRQIGSLKDHYMVTKISDVGGTVFPRCAARFDLPVSGSCYMHETVRVSEVIGGSSHAFHYESLLMSSSYLLGVDRFRGRRACR